MFLLSSVSAVINSGTMQRGVRDVLFAFLVTSPACKMGFFGGDKGKGRALGVNSIGLKTVGRFFRCLLGRIFRRTSGVKSSWAPI